jgi:hypothetical protein
MNSNEYIYSKLIGDTDLITLVGSADKIVGGVADVDIDVPLVSIFRLNRERAFSQQSIQKHIFQLSVWASTDVEADEIGDRIDDILH